MNTASFRRRAQLILAAVLVSSILCSCSAYDKEFLSAVDYESPIQIRSDENKIIVRNINELKIAILTIFDRYREPDPIRAVVFDSTYDGDPVSDISLACKQTITENARCAYCVADISYEIYKVVAYYEAVITVSLAETADNEITKLNYSGELKKYLNNAIETHDELIVLFADYSNYTEEDIRGMVSDYYAAHPLSVPKEPNVHISVFSGSGKQKLYEIHFDYGFPAEELDSMMDQIHNIHFPEYDENVTDSMSSIEKAAYACAYLMQNCEVSSSSLDNTAFSALVTGKAESRGLSLAMTALCNRLGLDSIIVYGQRSWRNHYWNILNIDGNYYHVDIEACITDGIDSGFLLNDESMWKTYRWDLSGYPQCSEVLSYDKAIFSSFLAPEEEEEDPFMEDDPEIIQHNA